MNDWQRFFDHYADRYDAEVFTQNTETEVPFLIEHLHLEPGRRVLDLGCGTGRHGVGLARRGMVVTGVDISPGMLAIAARRAADARVEVEWLQSNARDFRRPGGFDAAICLCEGAMCLLAGDDDPLERDMAILRNVYDSLREGGRLVLNVLNACRHIRMYSDEDVLSGRFDVVNLTERSELPPGGLPADGPVPDLRERGYTPPEIRRMLQWVGFSVSGVYGGTAGDWGLRSPKLDEYELMVIARKPAGT